LYTALVIVAQILAQQSFLFDVIPHSWRSSIGLQHYSQLDVDWNGLGVVVSWFSFVVLFWAVRGSHYHYLSSIEISLHLTFLIADLDPPTQQLARHFGQTEIARILWLPR